MKNKRMIVLAGIAAVSLAVFTAFIGQNQNKSLYKPTAKAEFISGEEDREAQGFNGAADWWFNRMKNQLTGTIDLNEVVRGQQLSNEAIRSSAIQRSGDPSMNIASVSWTELGPDNVGGRTRAILFDNQDPTHTHMFAGGVSGGLFESFDGALTWTRCAGFFSAASVVNTVVTIAQAPNGDLYVGTGEGNFYPLYAFGAGGFVGGGIYKSTDRGLSWNVLPSTQPTSLNSSSNAWVGVNKIACDPANSQHIYAGTNKGFKISSDGGATWVAASGPAATVATLDVKVTNNGHVLAICSNKPWLSTDYGATFTNVSLTGSGWPASNGRVTISIAPSDPNYVYAFIAAAAGSLQGVYVSQNGGTNWTQVCGVGNAQFEPFNNNQGGYDNIVSVDPNNKFRAIFGGTALFEWDMIDTINPAGQWTQIALEFPASPFNPYYVHSDKHEIIWHPTIPGVFYIGCDGGIFRTINNGQTYSQCNAGYNVTQCYSVAIENTAGLKNQAMAGCQDNGTNFVDGTGNTSMSSRQVSGGDGAWCDLSFLNPQATFQTVYYGSLNRTNNRGLSYGSGFYDTRIDPASNSPVGVDPTFASFVTPERLWESTNDLLTGDSIVIANGKIAQTTNVTTGATATYTGTLSNLIPQASPVGTIIPSSIIITCGVDSVLTDGAGVFSGDGTGSYNVTTGAFTVTFNTTPVANLVVKAFYYMQYGAGTIFTVNSNVQGKTLTHTVTSQVNPNDTVKIQDIIQAKLAVGFSNNNGIYITRRPIDFSTTPLWIKIGGSLSRPSHYSGECSSLAWSADGNYLFAGTSSGLVFRFGNLGSVTDSANGDIEHKIGSVTDTNQTCQVTCVLIGNFSGRNVTMLDVNPNNADQVVVSLGNYSNTSYVYYSTTATTATGTAGTFADKTGTLDNIGGFPAYTVCFDKYTPNRVLVGTEHGVFETSNITAAAPTWTAAMNGLDAVPVDMIRQQRFEPWQVPNAGCFYIGTHGRGIWRDDSSWQQPNGINSPSSPYATTGNAANHDLKVFPNPVVDNSNVTFNLSKQGAATVQIFDLTGKMVYAHNYENLASGTNTVQFETQDLVKGTYIITVLQGNNRIGSGRFIKMN